MKDFQVEMTYDEIGSFEFANLMHKLELTVTSNKNAAHMYQFVKRYKKFIEQLKEEYKKDVLEVFVKKDENGNIIANPQSQNGFDVVEGKEEEYKKATEDFGKRVVTFKGEGSQPHNFKPLNPSTLVDVKLSAKEIGLLGSLYVEDAGPGVPMEDNIRLIGKNK